MKIPKAKKTKSGNWQIQLRLKGKSHTITRASKKECEIAAFEYKAREVNNSLAPDYTLNELIDRYISAKSNVLSPATVKGYRSMQRHRFKDYQDVRINKDFKFQVMINEEAAKVSPKTLKNAWGLVTPALEFAGIPVPKVRLSQKVIKEAKFYDYEEVKEIVEALKGHPDEMSILLALHSLRVSELRALEKKNCKDGIIKVRGSIVASENGMVAKPQNKNDTSTRNIPIFIPRLNELIKEAPNGKLLQHDPDTIIKHWKKFCHENGFRYLSWHPIRHSFCSLCYHLQIPELETMRLGGWKDVNTMRKIYTHLAEKEHEIANEKLVDFFSEKTNKKLSEAILIKQKKQTKQTKILKISKETL